MMWAASLFLLVYVALKSGRLAFVGAASGYRGEPIGMASRLKAGEPALLIGAALLTVPPVLGAIWYHHHKFSAALHDSLICYGLIMAYRDAPEIMRSNGEHAVYLSFESHRMTALDAANQVGLSRQRSQRRLDDAATAALAERHRAGARLRRAQLAETQRCLHPPSEPPNA